jgi:hypothetical protein
MRLALRALQATPGFDAHKPLNAYIHAHNLIQPLTQAHMHTLTLFDRTSAACVSRCARCRRRRALMHTSR